MSSEYIISDIKQELIGGSIVTYVKRMPLIRNDSGDVISTYYVDRHAETGWEPLSLQTNFLTTECIEGGTWNVYKQPK